MPSTTASILVRPNNMPVILFRFRLVTCLLGGVGLLLGGCTAAPLSPTAYHAYLADPAHGLIHTVEVNGTTITCAYRPPDLLVLQDLASTPAAGPATRDSLARAYAGQTYCTLTFARDGQELENQFVSQPLLRQRIIDYLHHGIAADAFLVTSPRDSVPAAASFYVQQFGLSNHSTVVLVFATPQRPPTQDFHLLLQGQALGLGRQRFAFTAPDLAALPPLRYD
jgi:hypothetical protein